MSLVIRVKEIKGGCSMFRVGDEFTIEGAKFKIKSGSAMCIHALPSILHFSMALREGADPVELGLAREGKKAYVRCPDPGEPYTCGGGVIFEIERL